MMNKAVMRLAHLLRRPLPAALRRRIRLLLFQWLDLEWIVRSGVRLRVSSYGDWIIYNEIFVGGEYDHALRLALDSRPDPTTPLHIVDLGSNVGFFTLRVVDELRQRQIASAGLMITAVEGDSYCIEEFRSRVFVENSLSENVRLLHGLVGERTGAANLRAPDPEQGHNTAFKGNGQAGVRVGYVDLNPLFTLTPCIDLLKCDIEGAELLFIQNYPELLRKVRVAVFELHDDLCDTQQCRRLLDELGFTHQAVLRPGSPCSIYCVWR
jgi:FkbM family methyltransferase